jgi:nucleoside-diphosphate-sugar epimerase
MTGKILVTGANGLVGTDLVARLGKDRVVTSDLSVSDEIADVRDISRLEAIILKHHIKTVYHLAGLLSVGGEKNPALAWDVNINGLKNILDLAAKYRLSVFWPSSIAVFGPTTPKIHTPQHTVLEPTTIYGATKVAGELLCQYYFLKYGVDIRSLRYPGLIAWKAPPGDGTTEYSVHIFYATLRFNHYTCFLNKDSTLPMMYIDDAISGTLDLMAAPAKKITVRTGYNFSSLSFSPLQLVEEITRQHSGFTCDYQPDHRQAIADSWPKSIDDSIARSDWNWSPQFNLSKMVSEMLSHLKL